MFPMASGSRLIAGAGIVSKHPSHAAGEGPHPLPAVALATCHMADPLRASKEVQSSPEQMYFQTKGDALTHAFSL